MKSMWVSQELKSPKNVEMGDNLRVSKQQAQYTMVILLKTSKLSIKTNKHILAETLGQ